MSQLTESGWFSGVAVPFSSWSLRWWFFVCFFISHGRLLVFLPSIYALGCSSLTPTVWRFSNRVRWQGPSSDVESDGTLMIGKPPGTQCWQDFLGAQGFAIKIMHSCHFQSEVVVTLRTRSILSGMFYLFSICLLSLCL
jgi:hypothetical protein